MCPNQGELQFALGLQHRLAQGRMQRNDATERPQRGDALRNPGRMLEYRREYRDELARGCRVELRERNHGEADSIAGPAVPGSKG